MRYREEGGPEIDEIVGLFLATFSASEGADEGALVSSLAERIMSDTPSDHVDIFTARDGSELVGVILFTRLRFAEDERHVVLLSPVAVSPEWQGQGIGQGLIQYGLDALRGRGVDIAVTYGDPAFYGRVGFRQITADIAAPPYPLSQPEGWLGQTLDGGDFAPLAGASTCVAAFDDPNVW